MSKNFYSHVKSDKVKWVCTFVVCLLIVAALVIVSLECFGTGKTKPSAWFKGAEQVEQLPDNGENLNGEEVADGGEDSDGEELPDNGENTDGEELTDGGEDSDESGEESV